MKNKRGQLGISDLPSAVFLMGMAAVIGIIVAVIIVSVGNNVATDDCASRSDTYTTFNATAQKCQNSTGSQVSVGTTAFNVSGDGNAGVGAIFDNFSLIGLMIGLGIVLLVLVGVFVALRRTGAF